MHVRPTSGVLRRRHPESETALPMMPAHCVVFYPPCYGNTVSNRSVNSV